MRLVFCAYCSMHEWSNCIQRVPRGMCGDDPGTSREHGFHSTVNSRLSSCRLRVPRVVWLRVQIAEWIVFKILGNISSNLPTYPHRCDTVNVRATIIQNAPVQCQTVSTLPHATSSGMYLSAFRLATPLPRPLACTCSRHLSCRRGLLLYDLLCDGRLSQGQGPPTCSPSLRGSSVLMVSLCTRYVLRFEEACHPDKQRTPFRASRSVTRGSGTQ